MAGAREELGFTRTICGCAYCAIGCRERPGCLVPADLGRLCPSAQDVFTWAEQHLRARVGESYPVLVPARRGDGACHWLFEGRCAVHEHAPYGCAFFDSHMSQEEIDGRFAAAAAALQADQAAGGLYLRVWLHLKVRGLTAPPVPGRALAAQSEKILRGSLRNVRRSLNE